MRTLLLLALLTTNGILAQPFRWWHIGANIRLDTSVDPPIATTGGCLNNPEGVASVSDNAGNFLFATDGLTVFNRNCVPMPNGTGLLGGASSTQSGIIVQNPVVLNLYYVFTVSQDATLPGVCYSEVDMNLAAGFGAVTANKNTNLTPFAMSEKLTAVRHCNNVDIWVIAKRWNNNGFRAWLVSASGVDPVPVISAAGFSPSGVAQASFGQLKANPQGNKLLAAYYGLANTNGNTAELYDFDNATGIVSNAVSLGTIAGAYGAEFSPNGEIAYVSTNQGRLIQYNTCAGISVQIANVGPFFGSMQLTQHGNILIAKGSSSRLACIRNPNNLGIACNFTDNYITLPAASRMGLPNFVPYYFRPPTPMFTYNQLNCSLYEFELPTATVGCNSSTWASHSWEYLNTTNGTNSPVVDFPSGSHTVTLSLNFPCYTETQTISLTSSQINGLISGW